MLLILVRRPYDIGDRVCFLEPNAAVDNLGPPSGGWIVESVDLYTTTCRLGTTREYATFTNGSLANSRILNLKRSEKPNVYMNLKFTMNVTQKQLDEFRKRIIEFIKDRPREWIKVVSLRCTHVETEHQYLKYVLIVQHRESWQSYATIQISKGDIYIFALHLQKELKMEYVAPKLPVHLTGNPANALVSNLTGGSGNDFDNHNGIRTSLRYSFGDSQINNDAINICAFRDSIDDKKVTGIQSTQPSTVILGEGSNLLTGSQRRRASFEDDRIESQNASSQRFRVSFEDEKRSGKTKNKLV